MPDPAPKPRPRWLRRLLLVAVGVLFAAAAFGFFAVRHLDWIARFAIHRIFPGVTAEMGSLRVVSPTRLEVSKLSLRATKSHEPLLALAGGVVVFSFADIWRARLEEVRLTSPDLVVSPDLSAALGVQPTRADTNSGQPGNPLKWAIGRLVVTDGRLRITRFGDLSPSVEMTFAANLEDFGVGGESGHREHSVQLAKIRASTATKQSFLQVDNVDLRFTTDELFTHNRLRAVTASPGTLTVSPKLLDLIAAPRAKSSTAPGKATTSTPRSSWSLGTLSLNDLAVTVPDTPGPIGRIEFRIAAQLRELGAAGTPAADSEQNVTLSKLLVTTDATPAVPLLTTTRADVRFTIAGLLAHQLGELRLKNPAIDITPDSLLSPAPAPAANPAQRPAAADAAPAWLISRASCNFGTLRVRGLKDGTVGLTTKFAFNVRDLGTLGDAARKTHDLTLWDAQITGDAPAPFLTLDVGGITISPAGLAAHRIDAVKVNGGRLLVGASLQKLLAAAPAPAKKTAAPAPSPAPDNAGWSIGTLDLAGVRTRVEDRRPGVTDIRFTLNTTLRNIQAGGAASALLEEVQTVEFANINLQSPLNRAAKILSLRSVFIRFTLRDLARKHLREITILQPTIFLSQDLFVYMERASAGPVAPPVNATASGPSASSPPPADLGPNWSVDHLEVKFGRLVIGSGGSKDVGLPLEFQTTADNLALDNLATLQLQAILRVPKQSYDFPDYQIEARDVVGDLRFSYPPEKGEQNLVQKLDIASLRWRQYRADKSWVAVTFDARGINGLFGGAAYRGYLNGGFSFFFQDDSPWVGWIAGTDINTQAVTDVISPQNFRMTGPLDFEMQLDAFRKNISRVRGVFHLKEPGKLKIGKLDDLLANIPSEWTAVKQSSTRIALETLRDFDYTKAGGDFWFVDSQGILNLDLLGPLGSRKFEVALHDGEETQSKWQQGTLGKK